MLISNFEKEQSLLQQSMYTLNSLQISEFCVETAFAMHRCLRHSIIECVWLSCNDREARNLA